MKSSLARKVLVIAATAFPIAVSAFGPPMNDPPGCMTVSPQMGGMMPPPGAPGMGVPGEISLPPHLRHLGLTEEQQDKIFNWLHAQAPAMREKSRTAAKSIEELRRLAATDQFDAAKAKSLSETHGRALADLAMMMVETDAKIWTLLTAEQRKMMNAGHAHFMGKMERPDHPDISRPSDNEASPRRR